MATGTFVLVHGAWGGGWAWAPLAEQMRRRGHLVYREEPDELIARLEGML